MIDFRYHLVSIVAVFLALAVGIVLGSTALNSPITRGIAASNARLSQEETQLRAQKSALKQQLSAAQSFAQAAEPRLLDGLLTGQRVVLISAPGASSQMTSDVSAALVRAGATVTGQIQLQSQFFDSSASTQQVLSTLTQRLTPTGTTLRPGLPQTQAAELLASTILTQDGPGQPIPGQLDSASVSVLRGFAAGGFLTVSGQPAARATLAVVIIPATPPSLNDSNSASQGLVTLSQQLNLADEGTVVAGPVGGSGPGSAIDVMRVGSRAGHLSSVDNADTAIGQIVVAQALYEQLTNGKSGSYGTLADATAPGPSPAPTPSPSGSTAGAATSAAARSAAHPKASPSASGRR